MTYIALPLFMLDNEYQFCYKTDELTTHPSLRAAMHHVYHTLNPDAPRFYETRDAAGQQVWKDCADLWNSRWKQSENRWMIQFDAADDTELWGYEIVKAANR